MKDKEKQIFDKYGNYDFPTETKQDGLNSATTQIEKMKCNARIYIGAIVEKLRMDGCELYEIDGIVENILNYITIPEDSVVLSKEEYENIYEQAEQTVLANIADGGTSCHWCIEQHERKASKETVEKYISWLKENILSWGVCGNGKIRGRISITLEELEKFSKQFGDFAKLFEVEIKE